MAAPSQIRWPARGVGVNSTEVTLSGLVIGPSARVDVETEIVTSAVAPSRTARNVIGLPPRKRRSESVGRLRDNAMNLKTGRATFGDAWDFLMGRLKEVLQDSPCS